MQKIQYPSLSVSELLNAANKHYDERYLAEYFEQATGAAKAGAGDGLAEFIVRELRETFDEHSTRQAQVASAIRVLQNANKDIQNVIDGLRELAP